MAELNTEELRRRRLRGEIPEDAVAPMVSAMAGFTALGAATSG